MAPSRRQADLKVRLYVSHPEGSPLRLKPADHRAGNNGLPQRDAAVAGRHTLVQIHGEIVAKLAHDAPGEAIVLKTASRQDNRQRSVFNGDRADHLARRRGNRVVKARGDDRRGGSVGHIANDLSHHRTEVERPWRLTAI